MNNKITTQRQTKYCRAIKSALDSLGHATNAELVDVLRKSYPQLSATTVHRATARLARRNIIAIAPNLTTKSITYDANINNHDHFQCVSCNRLFDADFIEQIMPIIKPIIDGCDISGRLTISGICKKCIKKQEEI